MIIVGMRRTFWGWCCSAIRYSAFRSMFGRLLIQRVFILHQTPYQAIRPARFSEREHEYRKPEVCLYSASCAASGGYREKEQSMIAGHPDKARSPHKHETPSNPKKLLDKTNC